MLPEVPNLMRANLEKTVDAIRDFVCDPSHRLRLFGFRESMGMVLDEPKPGDQYCRYRIARAVRITMDLEDTEENSGPIFFDPLPPGDPQTRRPITFLICLNNGGLFVGEELQAGHGFSYVQDSKKAIQFSREEDARAIITLLKIENAVPMGIIF